IVVKVGDAVKIKAPVGGVNWSKYTSPLKVLKCFRNAVKTSDGKIWNLNRAVPLKMLGKEQSKGNKGDDMSVESNDRPTKEVVHEERKSIRRKYTPGYFKD
ncbi:hypothetical protein NDU88_001624, partial [Pleurodeles waltl]